MFWANLETQIIYVIIVLVVYMIYMYTCTYVNPHLMKLVGWFPPAYEFLFRYSKALFLAS